MATLLALRLNLKHCQAYETVATIGSQEQVLITNSYLYAMKLNDLVVLILDYTFHMAQLLSLVTRQLSHSAQTDAQFYQALSGPSHAAEAFVF